MSEREKITVQKHGTGFHVFMTVMTCGLWVPFWLADRRTITVRTRRY